MFGAKYVELIYPENPSPKRLAAGAVLRSRNVSTEVNTVFENLVGVLNQIDPAKLNAMLTALAEGVRGQGERIGQATTDANQVLLALNPRMDTVAQDWRSFKGFSDAYSAAAQDILARSWTPRAPPAPPSPTTPTDLDALLLNVIGFSQAGSTCSRPTRTTWSGGQRAGADHQPAAEVQPRVHLPAGGREDATSTTAAIRRSAATAARRHRRRRPAARRRPVPVSRTTCRSSAAKGGPGGKPGCGSLPDVAKNFPVRQLVTNTGWGTGLDIRPNPGIGHPCWANFFPVTRAVPEPPSIRQCLPGPGDRAGALPGSAALRRTAVRPGRHAAVSGRAAGAPDPAPRAPRGDRPARRRDQPTTVPKQEHSRERQPGRRRRGAWRIFAGGLPARRVRAADGLRAVAVRARQDLHAEFTNVSGLKDGNFVRIAGVEVGKVKKISINPTPPCVVEFSADDSVVLTEGTRAVDPLRRPIGGRYLALEEGAGGLKRLDPGQTIPLDRTEPALDLDALIGGFRPLFRALDPDQVNALTGN